MLWVIELGGEVVPEMGYRVFHLWLRGVYPEGLNLAFLDDIDALLDKLGLVAALDIEPRHADWLWLGVRHRQKQNGPNLALRALRSAPD